MFNEHEDLAPEQCPDCGSNHTRTDWIFNFHKCEDCSALWAFDKNDPDYEEALYLSQLPNEDDEYVANLIRKEDEKEEEEFMEEMRRKSEPDYF